MKIQIKEIDLDKLDNNPTNGVPLMGKMIFSVHDGNITHACSADISQKGPIFDIDKVDISNISGFKVSEADLRSVFKKWYADEFKGAKLSFFKSIFTYKERIYQM